MNPPGEDPPTLKFTWTIPNFTRLNTRKHYSDIFVVGGYKWRISIFPKGNNVDHLSMYLDVADTANLPSGWSRYSQFSLAVLNQINSIYSIRKESQHQFNARESDWGFTSFMPLSELYDPSRGYLVNDTVLIEAEVAVREVLDCWSYDSKKEQEEKEDKRKYKAQAHIFTTIKVARDEDISEQIGKNIYFDLVDYEKVRSFRIQKQTHFQQFKEEVAKEFGVPVQLQRFWILAERQNHTYRPNRPLLPHEELQTVDQIREASNKASDAELKLFLEIERGPDERPIPPPDKSSEDILLFFKLYDPENAVLRYVGRLMVKSSSKPMDIVGQLNQMAGFAPDEDIELFEEIRFEPCVMCEDLDKNTSFRLCQIADGDIICYQKPFSNQESECPYPDVPSFLEYVRNREVVRFRNLERPKEDAFTIELSKLHTYDDVVERLAEKLGLDDPSKIRLTSQDCYSQQPQPQPIKYCGVDCLSDILAHFNQTSDILYYEVLDIPLPELQGLKTLKVAFHHATKDEVVIHNIRLPKQSTVGDLINELKTKVELSDQDAELRLLQVFFHKIYKIFPSTERIENINDQYWTLRAEEIPEEEKKIGPNDRLIHVYHFTKSLQQQVENFGEPFFLVIHEGETLEEIKTRIQKKLHVPDEDFAKWKFASISMGRPYYLQDTDVVYNRFQIRDVYGAWEQYLGLEHIDNAPKRAYAANQKIANQVGSSLSNEIKTPPKEEKVEKPASAPEAKTSKPSSSPSEDRIFASPLAKKLADDKSAPLSSIKGTGPEGRIVKADVEEFLASCGEETTAKPSKLTDLKVPALDYVDIPHTQVTASRLAFSKQTIPHYYLTVDTCVDKMMGLRSQLNSFQEATGGKRISVNDLVIKAAALSLRKVPQCNSSWTDEYIRQFSNVNINVAVQTENGLYFPVVKDADKKGLSTIGEEVRFLAQKAKENSLKPEDYEGGTFTVSNLGGPFGIKQFCAVINPPQAAILAIGSAEKRVVAGSAPDQFNVASYMSVTLSCDHRVIDGAIGAEWLKAFKGYIETPESMLL